MFREEKFGTAYEREEYGECNAVCKCTTTSRLDAVRCNIADVMSEFAIGLEEGRRECKTDYERDNTSGKSDRQSGV